MHSENRHLFERAKQFLTCCYSELNMQNDLAGRLQEVEREIKETGTYFHTKKELTHGARMAWRNSNRCIGRLYWKTLKVIDARHTEKEDEIFTALEDHIHYAFNGGDIRSVVTVFRQQMPGDSAGPRILNHQLIRFAGHYSSDRKVIGDPAEIDFTTWCASRGFSFEQRPFEVLPVAIQWPNREAVIRKLQLPHNIIVPIHHPEFSFFEKMKWQWYALPVISDMMLEVGGVAYTAAPFNGWYMVTEIGSRNFGDANRYNVLADIANKMKLDTSQDNTLWKDRALVEINRAVLYSFNKAGVTISSHHESARDFIHFEKSENKKGREVTADWAWINPPMSASATEVFHREYDNTVITPNFFYQDSFIQKKQLNNKKGCPFHSRSLNIPKEHPSK